MVIDLCQVNYQTLLITYLEFIIKNANNAWKKKLECEFIGFKNGRLITNAKNVEINTLSQKMKQL